MLRKNDVFEMTCESFGQDAQGVCRHEGMAVFVPGLLPGERALVRIVKPEKRYAFGRIDRQLSESPDRRAPFCPIYKRCGGCSCQHMRSETTLKFKRDQVQELLRRCFEDLGCTGVWCVSYDGNAKSRRVQEKCGFRWHHTEKDKPCSLMGDIRTEHFTYLSKVEWSAAWDA